MKFLLCAGLLFAGSAFASPAAPKMYNLDIKVEKEGKPLSVNRLSVIEGETARVSETNDTGGTFVEVIAKEQKKNKESDRGSVLVQLTVGGIDAKGKQTIYGTPQLIALENEPAMISTSDVKKGKAKGAPKSDLSVSVTARSE